MAGVQRKSGCALTIRLLGRTEIRRLAKELEFRPRKSLGQNFVHDANTVRRVVSSSGVNRQDHVLDDHSAQQDAAQKAQAHAATPAVTHFDALGRACLAHV